MSISLKAELEIWVAALKAYDDGDFEKALGLFSGIADSSKILTNMGLIYATIGEHEIAIQHFVAATELDSYLAIAYFQCGVSNFLIERYDLALLNFEDAYLYLRGNEAINYEQIGLKFKLLSAEIMFNKGLAQLNLGYAEQGMADMQEASRQKVTDEHDVIDEAIRDHGDGYTVFSIPIGVLYRPSENKIKNSKSKDYLGKAKLVAASDSNDAFTEFTGVKKLKEVGGQNSDDKEDTKNKRHAELPMPSDNAATFTSRTETVAGRHAALGRSKTAPQRSGGICPDGNALASRRTQSVSNVANAPRPTGLPRSTASGRSITTQAINTTTGPVVALRTKTPQDTASGAVLSVGSTSGREEVEATATEAAAAPSLWSAQGPGMPRIVSASQPSSVSIQAGRYVIPTQDVTPLVHPAPTLGGHLTQFYDTFIDAYTDDPALRLAMHRSPQSYLPPQEQEQLPPAWMSSTSSPMIAISHTTNTSAPSRPAYPRVSQVVETNGNTTMVKGGRTVRRNPSQMRKGKAYQAESDDEDDEGFVAGNYDVFGMANIRVKLHYQGDVRGMMMYPTTSFNEFVERVTAKFQTSLTGLGMKFVDEEGTKISLRDESDFELAIETARENTKGRSEGKIEVWCMDL